MGRIGKIMTLLFLCAVLMTGCQKSRITIENETEDAAGDPAQLSSAVARCGDILYYLGNTETDETGDAGCYLFRYGGEEKDWLSYTEYGRGIYADKDTLYVLSHDAEIWTLVPWNGKEKAAEPIPLAAYQGKDESSGVPFNLCIRVYHGYVYLMSGDTQAGGLTASCLKRICLEDGSSETIYKAKEDSYLYDQFLVNGNYISFTVNDHTGEERMLHLYALDSLEEVEQLEISSYHYAMDQNGTLYYGCRVQEDETALSVKKVGQTSRILYRTENTSHDGVFDVFYDGQYLYLDNRTFCGTDDQQYETRKIRILKRNGELAGEIHFDGLEEKYGNMAVMLSSVVYSDDDLLMLYLEEQGVHRYLFDKKQIAGGVEHWEEMKNAVGGIPEAGDASFLKNEFQVANVQVSNQGVHEGEASQIRYQNREGENKTLYLTYNATVAGAAAAGCVFCPTDEIRIEFSEIDGGELLRVEEWGYTRDKDTLDMFERDYLERTYVFLTEDGTEVSFLWKFVQRIGKLTPGESEKKQKESFLSFLPF